MNEAKNNPYSCRYCGCHQGAHLPDCLTVELVRLRTQLDEVLLKDRGKTKEINLLTKENSQQAEEIAALQEILEDKRRMSREIDTIINGTNAAEQASLCDLIPQISGLVSETREAKIYLTRLFSIIAPQCKPSKKLLSLCAQIDNYIAGQADLLEKEREASLALWQKRLQIQTVLLSTVRTENEQLRQRLTKAEKIIQKVSVMYRHGGEDYRLSEEAKDFISPCLPKEMIAISVSDLNILSEFGGSAVKEAVDLLIERAHR